MKPPRSIGIHRSPVDFSHVKPLVNQMLKVLSNISFGTTTSNVDADMNMQVWKATGVSPVTPNTEFAVTHNLSHVPIGFMVVSANVAGHLFKSTTAWTRATPTALGSIFLKADVASITFTIIIL